MQTFKSGRVWRVHMGATCDESAAGLKAINCFVVWLTFDPCTVEHVWSLHTRLTTHAYNALALWWVIGEMVTLETFHLREAILALSQHYRVPDFSKAKRCQTNLKQIEWLYGRGREYMGMQKNISQPEWIRDLQHLVQWRGPPSDLGDNRWGTQRFRLCERASHNLNRPGWPWTTPRQPDRLSLRSPASVQTCWFCCKLSASQATTFCLHLYFWSCKKRKVIIDLACTCRIANEERHGMFRSPATARPPIRSTRRGRERFLVWILSYCYNILSFSRTHNFGREFVHIMCLRSWFFFYTPPDPVIKVVFHCSGPSNVTKLTQNYTNKTVA